MYKITIVREETKEVIESDYEKIADSGNKDGGAMYGYVKHPVSKDIETVVYTQRVEDVDMKAVIDAVNLINTQQSE